MPTIIDSLIVSLTLDPKGFDQGQKNSAEALRKLEQHARGINQTLTTLSTQSRRTGTNIAAGAAVGATGLKNLAAAGVEAFAALKTVEGIISSLSSSASRGANVSRSAWAIGLPGGTHRLDTIIQAAYEAANVPQQTSISMLDAYQQRIAEQKRTGNWSNEFREVGKLGVNFDSPIEQQIRQIRAALHNRPGPETESWLNAVGLGPWLHYLKLSQGQANSAERKAGAHSLTADQGVALEKLQSAAHRVEDSYVHLWETITADFSKSGLATALEGLSAMVDATSKNETAVKALEIAVGVVAAGSVVTLASALWKLVAALNAVWAAPLMRLAVSGGLWRVLGPIGAFLGVMAPGTAGKADENSMPGADPRVGEHWRKHLHPGSTGGASSGHGDPRGQEAGLRSAAAANGLNPDDVVAWAGAEGLHAKDYATWDVNNWSYGALQMHKGGLADEYQRATGRDPADPANEGHMNAWAVGYAAKNGFGKWTSITGGKVAAPRRTAPINASSLSTPFGSGPDTTLAKALANIRAAGAGGGSSQRTTNNDVDANINTINVHTQASDAAGIGGAIGGSIRDVIRKNTLISGANSGLE